MAGCCGSDGRTRTGRLIWTRVYFGIAALILGLWAWERQPHHHHAGVGPHGGPLADWGDGTFHLEVVHDRDTEAVTVYVLDRWAKKSKTIDAATLTLTLQTDSATAVRLEPVPNEGDPPGRHSRYIGRHSAFKAEAKLTGNVSGTAGGKSYSGDFSQN